MAGVALVAKYKTMERHLEQCEIKLYNKKVGKTGYVKLRKRQAEKFRMWYIIIYVGKLVIILGLVLTIFLVSKMKFAKGELAGFLVDEK